MSFQHNPNDASVTHSPKQAQRGRGRGSGRGGRTRGRGRGRTKGSARPTSEDLTSESDEDGETALSWKHLTRDKDYLASVAPSKKKLPLGEEYDPRRTTLLGGPYDLGLAAENLPDCLKLSEDTPIDVDYAHYAFRPEDVGVKGGVLMRHDTLCYQWPSLRSLYVPDNKKPLFLTRGPGVSYVLVDVDAELVKSGETTVEAEIKQARDDFLKEVYDLAPSMALQPSNSPDLVCKSHQTFTGRLLRKALVKLEYKAVYHVLWGTKCSVGDLEDLDKAAEKAKHSDPTLSNLFDVAATYKTEGVPLVSSWPVRRARRVDLDQGDRLAQPNATPMRCYAQAPGLFHRPFGSTQTRNKTPWPGVEKLTMYNKTAHHWRSRDQFKWLHPAKVGRGQANLKHLRGAQDELATCGGMSQLTRHGLGLRVEVRVQATTANEAVNMVEGLGILDPVKAWSDMGQFQLESSADGRSTTTHYPVWLVSPQIFVANGMRVTQAARVVMKGRSTKEATGEMAQANVDAFAAAGHTDKGRRATTGFTQGSFWVHDVEKKRDVPAVGKRSNPPRQARRPAFKELSGRQIYSGESSQRSSGGGTDPPRLAAQGSCSNVNDDEPGRDDGGDGPEEPSGGPRELSAERPARRETPRLWAPPAEEENATDNDEAAGDGGGGRGEGPAGLDTGRSPEGNPTDRGGDLGAGLEEDGLPGGALETNAPEVDGDSFEPDTGGGDGDEDDLFGDLDEGGVGDGEGGDVGGDDLEYSIGGNEEGAGNAVGGLDDVGNGPGAAVLPGDDVGGDGIEEGANGIEEGGGDSDGGRESEQSPSLAGTTQESTLSDGVERNPGSNAGGGASGETARSSSTGGAVGGGSDKGSRSSQSRAGSNVRAPAFGLEAAARRQGCREDVSGAGSRKRGGVELNRGFPSDDRELVNGRSVRPKNGNPSGRPLPKSELLKMQKRVKTRTAPFSRGGVTWTTKPKEVGGRPGAGVACESQGAVYLTLWEMFGYEWVKHIQESGK